MRSIIKFSGETVQLSDGAINEWIGYAPTLKEGEGLGIKKTKWENIEYEGKDQMEIIMLDIQFNSMEEGNGFAELAKPMYDKKMWDDDGAWIQPPTFRAVADIVLVVVPALLLFLLKLSIHPTEHKQANQ